MIKTKDNEFKWKKIYLKAEIRENKFVLLLIGLSHIIVFLLFNYFVTDDYSRRIMVFGMFMGIWFSFFIYILMVTGRMEKELDKL